MRVIYVLCTINNMLKEMLSHTLFPKKCTVNKRRDCSQIAGSAPQD